MMKFFLENFPWRLCCVSKKIFLLFDDEHRTCSFFFSSTDQCWWEWSLWVRLVLKAIRSLSARSDYWKKKKKKREIIIFFSRQKDQAISICSHISLSKKNIFKEISFSFRLNRFNDNIYSHVKRFSLEDFHHHHDHQQNRNLIHQSFIFSSIGDTSWYWNFTRLSSCFHRSIHNQNLPIGEWRNEWRNETNKRSDISIIVCFSSICFSSNFNRSIDVCCSISNTTTFIEQFVFINIRLKTESNISGWKRTLSFLDQPTSDEKSSAHDSNGNLRQPAFLHSFENELNKVDQYFQIQAPDVRQAILESLQRMYHQNEWHDNPLTIICRDLEIHVRWNFLRSIRSNWFSIFI